MLLLADYPDPQGAPGATIPGACLWIAEVHLRFAGGGPSITAWVHRTPEAAATWSGGAHGVPPADTLAFYPGEGGLMSMDAILTAADALASADPALTPWDALRAALYDAIRAARFPDATEVE